MVLAVLPKVALVEVAEGVLEPSDYLIQIVFFSMSFMKHISNVNFWPRIAYLFCTWRSTLRAS